MRHLYLAATGQNRGKTTAALGLLNGFVGEGLDTGFMKPVGQRTVIDDGQPADEDAVLMRTVFGLPEAYSVLRNVVEARRRGLTGPSCPVSPVWASGVGGAVAAG